MSNLENYQNRVLPYQIKRELHRWKFWYVSPYTHWLKDFGYSVQVRSTPKHWLKDNVFEQTETRLWKF